ncbi:MAG TPA: hypothetical protein VFL27_00555 [Candidatus Dormibacteraeota bacterium]|nr:hypothetical protein [Candidatus Dormibacteraeota bacterium]
MRWLALAAGAALIVLAFAAAGRVTDTREGLVAEIVTLLGGGVGFLLLIYAFAARKRPAAPQTPVSSPARPHHVQHPRSSRDLVLGGAGIVVALVLVSGLAFSGGVLWAGLGLALLLPMLAGSVYLCVRYLRANP